MCSILLTAVALISSASIARADWAYTKWGMSPEQVEKASNGAAHFIPEAERKTVAEAARRTGAEGTYRDCDLGLQLAFAFDAANDGLRCVFYSVADAQKNSALRELMIKRFGEPSGHSDIPAIGMTAMNWERPDEMDLRWVKDTPGYVSHCKKA